MYQSTSDLFLLIVLTAVILALYQYKQKIFFKNRIKKGTLTSVIIFIFAFLVAFVIKKHL